MQPSANPSNDLTPVKRALLEIRELRARLEQAERPGHEPVAVVGLALRMPGGAVTPEAFWDLLASGGDAITPIPRSRWDVDRYYDSDPEKPGGMVSQYGAFLDNVDGFDPEFFGIAPREAELMDPQHRMLLEMTWEALERAGIPPPSLAGSKAGIFLGLSNSDYGRRTLGVPAAIDAHSVIGGALSIAAGRLSYFLGAHGPALVTDTACSASLVAIHLACQSLRSGESSIAITGGINLILSPEVNIGFSRTRMLAADGHCKTFDASADGYVRGEGGGLLVLKRLSDALAAGDPILAVLRGSAVNQDGRSAGLTAPNGPAQEMVIDEALAAARIEPSDVSYVEAHGTGTPLGDPIEVRALTAVYGKSRSQEAPLQIGSVKTNIGHLEAGAGIAALIKVILSLQHNAIPPHLNLRVPSPYIDWSAPIRVPVALTPWNRGERPRVAGVSGFGFSGTNCHVLVEEAPPAAHVPSSDPRPLHLLCLSARTHSALTQLAQAYVAHLRDSKDTFADICFTAAAGRAHHGYRLAVQAATAEEAGAKVSAWLAGEQPVGLANGIASDSTPKLAFLFTGQGAQYPNMARTLYETSPVFRDALDHCDEIARNLLPLPLLSVIFEESGAALHETFWAQPALFAVQYSLATLWKSWGIRPDIVMGHSLGEFVAACIAGSMNLPDAVRLVVRRGELMSSLPAGGAMAAIAAPEADVRQAIEEYRENLGIAAINGPEDVVISGRAASVDDIVAKFAGRGVQTKILRISNGFHSPLCDPVLAEFEKSAAGAKLQRPNIAYVSNLTGKIEGDLICSPSYWSRHMREPVQFSAGVRTILGRGTHILMECGPHPALTALVRRTFPDQTMLPSLHRDRNDWEQLLDSLAQLYVAGAKIDWTEFDRPYHGRRVLLPVYPFQRRPYWVAEARHDFLPAAAPPAHSCWPAVVAAASAQSNSAPIGWDPIGYPKRQSALQRLTLANIRHTLCSLGAFQRPGESHTASELLDRFHIPAAHAKLVGRWLKMLAGAGFLEPVGALCTSATPLAEPDLAQFWRDAEQYFGNDPEVLAYLRNCGEKLPGVIAGKISPLETLFPDGSFVLAEGIYQHSLDGRYINQVAAAALTAAVRPISGRRTIRVLELGGGTGGTTASLLPLLPAERTEYWFTDVSDLFLARAAAKFSQYPFVRYLRADLERPLSQQNIPEAAFDAVIAANVVHAIEDLNATFDRLRRVLLPGGLLLLVETTEYHPWLDMSVALIEGWSHFKDGLRQEHPLLAADAWLDVVRKNGFAAADRFPAAGSPANLIGQHVIVACTPGAAASLPELPRLEEDPQAIAGVATPIAAHSEPEIIRQLNVALPAERCQIMIDYVSSVVRQVLRLDAERSLGSRERLTDLGMDSLMALDLRSGLTRGLNIPALPSTVAFDAGTAEALSAVLLESMFPSTATVAPPSNTDTGISDQVANMSDEEVERALLDRFAARN